MVKIVIQGRLAGINEYTAAQRTARQLGAKLKRQEQNKVILAIRQARVRKQLQTPIWINYKYFEPNRRRDKDNISGFAHKVIQDALVECGVLADDGWAEISGWTDSFEIDKKSPRIEVEIIEGTEVDNGT